MHQTQAQQKTTTNKHISLMIISGFPVANTALPQAPLISAPTRAPQLEILNYLTPRIS